MTGAGNQMQNGNKKMHLLCTGGAGYIGGHTVVQLVESGYRVTILDNLSNSSKKILPILEDICGCKLTYCNCDIRDEQTLLNIFKINQFDGVIHFAGLKAVGESVEKPLEYYECNVGGTIALLKVMRASGCKRIVFSSSATVYKAKREMIREEDPLGPSNPYGQTKIFIEQILKDLYISDSTWQMSILRYFNPVGCHSSHRIGESPAEPNNLLPFIQQVAVGRKTQLCVFGNDWDTDDGTGVRDYLHVVDLADGHVAAFKALTQKGENEGCYDIYNLGTGRGVSVLQLKQYFEEAAGKHIPHIITERRPGDLASVIADPSKAERELKWKAKKTIQEACKDAWIWQSTHPYGFDDPQ